MSNLPDELWATIFEIGIISSSNSNGDCLSYRDLCSLSITCKRFNSLISSDQHQHSPLWFSLLSADFKDSPPPPPPLSLNSNTSSSSYKALYRIRSNSSSFKVREGEKTDTVYWLNVGEPRELYRYERERDQKRLAHRRIVLRFESEIAVSSRKVATMELQSADEREKMKTTLTELLNLRKVRQASVALNVWQPRVIRGKQKQMVEQCDVPIDSRIGALEMELRLCKQQIANYDLALVERRKIDRAKEKLESVNYHPLQMNGFSWKGNESSDAHSMRRKKLKHT